jgi:serine protease Do
MVTEDSPAAKAGLKPGDVINAVNGMDLQDEDLDEKIAVHKPGSTIQLGYMRSSSAFETTVTVGTNAQ